MLYTVIGDAVYSNVMTSCVISTYFYWCYPIKMIQLVGRKKCIQKFSQITRI